MENELWGSANELRANSKLTAAEYKDPVLGLILLRYAQNRYEQAREAIENSGALDGPRGRRVLRKEDFLGAGAMMLPEKAQYEYLANLPEGEDISEAVNTAMKLIEEEYPDLAGVLPRNYQEMDAELLTGIIRVFNKDAVKTLPGDVFGRIYEFFLMKFSMVGAGAQEGGEFFTPPSLVQLIVNLIEPDHGIIHDAACGSGGMFVQTGHFFEEHQDLLKGKSVNEAVTVYGSELKSNNAKLAKMNLAIHGLEGTIKEANSFYSDPHDLVGKCDFVMANPPFNVKKVDKSKDYVKNDVRLFDDIGIPKADNGNYLWIQYFYHYLNQTGRAGFVMASSATDAGNTEKAIRQKLIESGAVNGIVSVGNNFFYTRSLPCHVWFLDKGKKPENQDKILMIDARNTFRKVTTTLNDYSPGQQLIFSAMMQAYRKNSNAIAEAETAISKEARTLGEQLAEAVSQLREDCQTVLQEHRDDAKVNQDLDFTTAAEELSSHLPFVDTADYTACHDLLPVFDNPTPQLTALLEQYAAQVDGERKTLIAQTKQDKLDKKPANKASAARRKVLDEQSRLLRKLELEISRYQTAQKQTLTDYKQWLKDWHFLQISFPDNTYQDVEGLCKIVDLDEVRRERLESHSRALCGV